MSIPRSCSGHLYEVLEVDAQADVAAIRRQYKKMALQYHPDRNNGTTRERFQEIEEAHRILCDPEKRNLYDMIGRENMKTLGDNPMMEMILSNSSRLIVFCGMLVLLTGGALLGMLLAMWRFDRQYALSNGTKGPSFSWWFVSIPFLPLALLICLFSLFMLKKVWVDEGMWEALPVIPWALTPVFLCVAVGVLNGQVSLGVAFTLLAALFLLRGVRLWHRFTDTDLELYQSSKRLGFQVGMSALFQLFLLIRINQSPGGGISFFIVGAPLMGLIIASSFNPVARTILGFTVIMWSQKLQAELVNGSGYDPRAFTATLGILLPLFALSIASVLMFIGILSNRSSETRNDISAESAPVL